MKNKNNFRILLLAAIDFILLFLMVAFGVRLISEIIGPDVIEYENWSGNLKETTAYRFGAGCWQYTIFLAKFILFTVLQIKQSKELDLGKPLLYAGIFLHLIFLILGVLYVYNFGNGYSVSLLIEHLFIHE